MLSNECDATKEWEAPKSNKTVCNCKDGVYKKLTEYYVWRLMRFLSVNVIDAASSK